MKSLSQVKNRDKHPRDHLAEMLDGEKPASYEGKLICANTRGYADGAFGNLTLHSKTIMVWDNKSVRMYAWGYRTVTTKDRLNRFTPDSVRVFSKQGVWYLTDYLGTRKFHDGIKVRFP